MKIIFLDVDGVLNHSKTPEWATATDNDILDTSCVFELTRILYSTRARVVLSSSWRFDLNKCKKLFAHFHPSSFIGATPEVNGGDERKDDILKWLAAVWPLTYGWCGEVITHLAVLDDDTDADLGDGSFFKTDFKAGGLTKEIADRIIIHLGGTV